MTAHRTIFVVTGRGPFPVDMLCYDRCFPVRTEDAMALVGEPACLERRQIRLAHVGHRTWEPTRGRWRSFGWTASTEGEPLYQEAMS